MRDVDELLAAAGIPVLARSGTGSLASLTDDSRTVLPGSGFVAMPSGRTPPSTYLGQALMGGAEIALVPDPESFDHAVALGLPARLLPSNGAAYNAALGRICRELYGDPSQEVKVIGITGTNGKTTTAWIVAQALRAVGVSAGYLGTLGFDLGSGRREGENTTPTPCGIWQTLVSAREAGCSVLAMEVSSHALVQRRVAGVSFALTAFTHLSLDHLDYHRTMERYAAAKELLFSEVVAASRAMPVSVLPMADPQAEEWSQHLPGPVLTYGGPGADSDLLVEEVYLDRIVARTHGGIQFQSSLGGRFNAQNLACAAAILQGYGLPDAEIARGLSQAEPVPGRFQTLPNSRGIVVMVDYAHTPDALEKLLDAVRDANPARVITVVGCGGDRDPSKRPLMARAALDRSDLCIFTSDNPRTEDPAKILSEMVSPLGPEARYERHLDREVAIRRAIQLAQPGDAVVLAGKGHEEYQIVGHEKLPFSDTACALEALR